MNLSHLTDEALEQKLKNLVKSEREILTEILHHFREVERRRLYCKHKCSSLFEYAVKVHGYTEKQANSRISAMRLLKEIPQIEEKIASGALSLSNLVSARTMFRKEKKASITRTIEQKIEVLEKLENCSTLKAVKVLESESFLEPMLNLQLKGINRTFFSDEKLEAKLNRLLELKAKSNPNMALGELIDQMADECLSKWDPVEKAKRSEARKEKRVESQKRRVTESTLVSIHSNASFQSSSSSDLNLDQCLIVSSNEHSCEMIKTDIKKELKSPSLRKAENRSRVEKPGRSIRAADRHAVNLIDQGRCRNCGSGRATEFDHYPVPFALGGESTVDNLRLLCRACNQRHAIETFGMRKMQLFLREPMVEYLAG